jgi:hypothetical protein
MPMLNSHALKIVSLALLVLSFCLDGCKEDEQPVEKNEGLYINEIYAASGDDWFELYNFNDEVKDLSGYKVYDDSGNRYTLPDGTSIAAKDFLVIFCDDMATGLHTNFKLSSSGETLGLENASGELIDRVEYPVLGNGQVYGRFPDGGGTLGVSGFATQGTSNGSSQASLIQNVERTPLVPGLSDPVLITAEVLSNTGTPTVTLHYRVVGASFTDVAMTGSQSSYHGTIPPLNTTGKVEYYITATTAGNTTTYPFDATADPESYLLNNDPLPALRINEFMAINTACCPDDAGAVEEFDDWIEIYNAGATPVDIGGMYLSDDLSDPFKFRVSTTDPDLTTISPGGFLLMWADEEGSQGPLHANFQLAGDGEDVGLFYIDGRTIHSYSYDAQQENRSMGFATDGTGSFQLLSAPSPGASNN